MEAAQARTEAPPGAFAAFTRFVICGGGVGLAATAAVAGIATFLPWALANALVTVASTLLATELHARFTFGRGRRGTLRQHVQSAGSAAAPYAVTCTAMFLLHQLVTAPGVLLEQAVYLTASALAGIGRFLVLRLVVFATGHSRTTPNETTTTATTKAATSKAGTSKAGTSTRAVRDAPPAASPAAASLASRALVETNAAPAVCRAA